MKTCKPQIPILLVLLATLVLGGLTPIAAQNADPPREPPTPPRLAQPTYGSRDEGEFVPGDVLVKFKAGTSARSAQSLRASADATQIETLDGVGIQVWHVPKGRELATIKQIEANPNVEYAQPNYYYYALSTPNDPGFAQQWALPKVSAPAAWDLTTGSPDAIVAIVDTGIDPSHPDLAGKILPGRDFVDNDNNPRDGNGHGTHVAGIAAAVTNNGAGVAGMNWSVRILPVRVLDDQGKGPTTMVAAGIRWAYEQGAQVINLSLGSPFEDSALQDAISQAHANGSLIVAAMGNCRTVGEGCPVANPTLYPAAFNNVMAVAATGPSDVYAPYSQSGAHCDIAAPGGVLSAYHDPNGIYSTMPTYAVTLNSSYSMNYDYLQGTSQAAAFVSGLAALVWATNPGLGPDDVQAVIESTAVDLPPAGRDDDYGYGRINALAAVQIYSPPLAPTLLPIVPPAPDAGYLVDWNDVANATGYELQESGSPTLDSWTEVYAGSTSQHWIDSPVAGTWYYRVRAQNGNGYSTWSNVQAVTVRPLPPTLSDISNDGNEDEYVIFWTTPAAATSYELEEADNPDWADADTRYMGSAAQYRVTGQDGGTWYYHVRASNAGGDSGWSNVVSTTVGLPLLSAPTLTITNPSRVANYVVDWSNVPSATEYLLEQSRNPWFSSPTKIYTGTAQTYSVDDQPKGTWYYRVRALSEAGNGPWSEAKPTVVATRIYLPMVKRALIISQGFESGLVPPPGWSVMVHDTSLLTRTWHINTNRPYEGTYYASCSYDPDRFQSEVLLSPQFTLSSAWVQFQSFGSLTYCGGSVPKCSLDVWLVPAGTGGGSSIFVYRANQDWRSDFEWSPSNVDLTPFLPANTPVKVAFEYHGQDGAQISLDAIVISGN